MQVWSAIIIVYKLDIQMWRFVTGFLISFSLYTIFLIVAVNLRKINKIKLNKYLFVTKSPQDILIQDITIIHINTSATFSQMN